MKSLIIILFCCLSSAALPLWAQIKVEPLTDQQQAEMRHYKQLADELKDADPNESTRYLNKIASIYWENGHCNEAIVYFSSSLHINEQIGNINGIVMLHNNIAMNYVDLRQFDEAIKHYEKVLAIRRKKNEKDGIVYALINLGTVQTQMKNYDKALKIQEDALKIAGEMNNRELMRTCYGDIASTYKLMGNADKSIQYINFYTQLDRYIQEEELRTRNADASRRVEEAQLLARLMEAEKRAKELELVSKNSEIATKEEAIDQLTNDKLKANSLTEAQKLRIDLLNEEKAKDDALMKEQQLTLENAELARNSLIGGLLMVFGMVFALSYGYRQKQKANNMLAARNVEVMQQKEEISTQRDNMQHQSMALQKAYSEVTDSNMKITASINYARRIQAAMFHDEKELQNLFSDSFIFFRPRDIVSGDFYWFMETENIEVSERRHDPAFGNLAGSHYYGSKVIVAAVDCTGHGVPGAFLTMIGYNMLSEIVLNRHITEADRILNELHRGIRKALKQAESENRDGMDMALCVYDRQTQMLTFAGAKNPVLVLMGDDIHFIKGDKYGIGGMQKEENRFYQKHSIKITQTATVYMFSDGFQDQFGGDKGEKFSRNSFKEFLCAIHKSDMQEQKYMLEAMLESWMEKTEPQYKQLDDILVMGFKIQANEIDDKSTLKSR